MKKTYFSVFVLFVIVLIFVFFMGKSNKIDTPTLNVITPVVNNNTIPDTQNKIDDTIQIPIIDTAGVKVFTISSQNFSFIPSSININKGDKVRIIFQNTMGLHGFNIDEYGIGAQQSKAPYQEILEFTANKVGSFEYYCPVGTHQAMGMVGTLNVQ